MSTYKVNDITLFLSKRFPYAATCFAQDNVHRERIPASEVAKWFKSYFPSPTNHEVFRQMEAHCTGFMEATGYSLDCTYYTKSFPTLDGLINDIMSSGMDPNYEITLNGKRTREIAADYLQY